MKRSTKFAIWAMGLVVLPAVFSATAAAQSTEEPPIEISLVADNTTYGPDDPIQIQVTVSNESGQDVISRYGWLYRDYQFMITFTDPDGIPITYRYAKTEPHEPGPPYRFRGRYAARVQIIQPAPVGRSLFMLDDARESYELEKYGWYKGLIRTSLEEFSEYFAGEGEDLFSYLDDPGRKEFPLLASNEIRFYRAPPEPLAASSVHVKVFLLKIGGGTRPGVVRYWLEGADVQLILKSKIPPDFYPINWKVYEHIWGRVDPEFSGITDANGVVKFEGVERDDWLVLAKHPETSDFKRIGSPIGADDPNWDTAEPIQKHLMVMEKPEGKKVPGKTTRRKGSELLITEPEYVEWDGTQETYPFVFESIGDWGVTTSVDPPEGFVSDYESLSADVVNEMEAVQFTITDVGSKWKETSVEHEIKHKGKTEKIQSKIGVKLSKVLAKEKGKDIHGDTGSPGPFRGGKKVKDKDKD